MFTLLAAIMDVIPATRPVLSGPVVVMTKGWLLVGTEEATECSMDFI